MMNWLGDNKGGESGLPGRGSFVRDQPFAAVACDWKHKTFSRCPPQTTKPTPPARQSGSILSPRDYVSTSHKPAACAVLCMAYP